jgi:hypothetical protein
VSLYVSWVSLYDSRVSLDISWSNLYGTRGSLYVTAMVSLYISRVSLYDSRMSLTVLLYFSASFCEYRASLYEAMVRLYDFTLHPLRPQNWPVRCQNEYISLHVEHLIF